MSASGTQPKPVFFWQGALIMLPVLVLAVLGLISLRQDEQAAAQDARKHAAENIQGLARAMSVSTRDAFVRFTNLRSGWTAAVVTAGVPGDQNHFFNDQLKAEVRNWEHDYPGLKLPDLAFPTAEILTNGAQIDPPDFPASPTPPSWFLELSLSQKALWEHLRNATLPAEIEKWRQAFVASNPSNEARVAAYNLFRAPEQREVYTLLTTDAGIYFEDIACYQLLSATNAEWTPQLLRLVRDRIIDHPSFMASKLSELAAGLPEPTNAELRQNVYWTEQWRRDESKVRDWLPPLRQLPGLITNAWNPARMTLWASWTGVAEDEVLAIFESMNLYQPDHVQPGYQLWFMPRAVVTAIFKRALDENRFFIPAYARAVIAVEGKPLSLDSETNLPDESLLLGAAMQAAGLMGQGVDFEVKFYLTDREQMLAGERHREMWMGMLILGALLAAAVGCLAARRAFRRQLQLNELKSDFVSSVSHELRAPIASVRLLAENLERGKVSEPRKQNEYFHFIVQECHRLSSLIENVLDFSRIEQGRKQYEFEPTDLVALVRTTVQLMEPYAAEKGVHLCWEPLAVDDGSSTFELTVDGRALQQALVNLMDNAIKHSAKDQVVTVGMEVRRTGLKILGLYVADHGPGIPHAEHEKIFERFYRLGSELRRETQGVGIGLSVVKHIVTAHQGQVKVDSEPGRGSRFTIELPWT